MSNVSMIDGHIDEPKGLTNEDIIKALECCKKAKLNQDCLDLKCPFSTEYGCNIDDEDLRNKALDLINLQKAEIERLRNALMGECMLSKCTRENEIKAEAYKEIIGRLKEHLCSYDLPNYHSFKAVDEDAIDEVLKEMDGE